MDIQQTIELGGALIPNPNYRKNNGQPKYIRSIYGGGPDVMTKSIQSAAEEYYDFSKDPLAMKVGEYDISPSKLQSERGGYNDILADAQSNWSKAFNALGQTLVSEVLIGIPKSMSDILDAMAQATGLSDKDYTNPVSEALEKARDTFNTEIAPIYKESDSGITNPDFAWVMSNIPSIASTLTLLYPTKLTMVGLKALANTLKVGKGVRKTVRALSGARKAKEFEELNAIQRGLNSATSISTVNAGVELGTSALIMRTMENYQESRQSFNDTYTDNLEYFKTLKDDEYEKWLVDHEELVGSLTDKSRNNVAKFIAGEAADRTFKLDYSNVFFDAIQLWGLRNFAKNLGVIKKNTSRAAAEAQAISTATAGKTATEATKIATEVIDKTPTYLRYLKYGGKQFVKTAFVESTEGIEEAVNYIAQEEGITYGKVLLGTETPTAFSDRFTKYIKSPDLYDATLWGTIGGVIFHEFGSIAEARQLYKKAKESKAKRDLNKETGESIVADDFIDYLEMADNHAAVAAIKHRNVILDNTIKKLQQIENNKNIFATEPGKEIPEFEGDIEAQKALAKERVLNEFISDVGLESINSGTYDLLKEYIRDTNVKQVFIDNGFAKKEEADVFSDKLVTKLEDIKRIYSGQLEHVRNQATYINTRKNSNPVRPEYIQIIAKENTQHLLNVRDLTDRLNVLQGLENSEDLDDATRQNLELHRQAIDSNTLATDYAQLTAQIERVKKDKSLNSVQKQIVIEDINSRRRIVLAELTRKYGHGELLMALRLADRINPDTMKFDDNLATKTDFELIKEFDKLADFQEIDKLLRNSGKTLTRFSASNKTIDDIVAEAQKVYEDYKYKFGADALARRSSTLAERFTDESILNMNIAVERSNVKQTTEEIQSRISQLHNQMNEARKQALIPATEIIDKLYNKYGDDFDKVIDVIKTAYTDGINNARKLAKDTIREEDVDKLIDAISIFNFSNDENALILKYISALIDRKNQEKQIITQATSAAVSQQTQQPVEETATETEPVNDERETKFFKVKVDKKGNVHVSNSPNGIEGRINEDGTIELIYSNIPLDQIGKILSTEYFEAPDFDILSKDFTIETNPIIKKEKNKWSIVSKGKLKEVSSPVEETVQEVTPESEVTPEPEPEPEPTPAKTIVVTEATVEDILADPTNSDAIHVVLNGFEQYIDHFGKEFDIAEAKQRIVSTYANVFNPDILGKIFDYYSNLYIESGDIINKKKNNNDDALETAAVGVAMASKFTDYNSGFYSALFSNTFSDFIELYINTLPTIIIEGKQAIYVNDLFALCNKIAKRDFNTEPYALFKVITGWLTSPNNTKYKVIGDLENPKDSKLTNTKTENDSSTEYRLEIEKAYSTPINTKAVSAVKAGDVLRVSPSDREIAFFDKDGYCVGRMPSPYKVRGNAMIALVKGFLMDLNTDKDGKVVSSIKDLVERIFLSDDADAAALRGLLYYDYSDIGLADAFVTNPIIVELYNQTVANIETTKEGKRFYHGPLYMYTKYGKDTVDYDKIFEHLKNVFRYTVGINEGNYEKNKLLIKASIDSYFDTQYDSYKAAIRLKQSPVETVTVTKASEGELVQVVDYIEGNYSSLTPITSAIANGQSAMLGVVDPYQADKVILSGGETIDLQGMSSGSTLLILNTQISQSTTRRTPVKAYGVRLDDAELNNPVLNEIIEALNKEVDRVCDKFVDKSIPMSERINEVNRFLTYLFDGTKKNNINVLQDHRGMCRVVTTDNSNNPNPTRTTLTFTNYQGNTVTVIFNTIGQYGTETASVSALGTVQVGDTVKAVSNTLLKAGTTDATLLKAQLKQLIAKNTAISLSHEGLRISNGVSQTTDANAYFKIQNVNGKPKFVIEIGDYRREYDSYESFMMSNNMLRVNTKVEKGHNFRLKGKNQINNKIIKVDIPSVPKASISANVKAKQTKPAEEVHILPNASSSQFADYVNITQNPTIKHKGKALVEAVTPKYIFDDNPDLVELIDELLPSNIVYDENYNDVVNTEDGFDFVGPVAQVNSRNAGRYFRYRQKRTTKNGKQTYSRGTIPHGTVVVGDRLLNLLAGNINEKREGIVKLIHERLHYIINNSKEFDAKTILSNIQDIYITFFDKFDEYCKRFDNGDMSVANALRGREYIEQWKKHYSKQIYDKLNNERKLEEFLVETLTSPSFMLFANEVQLKNINNKKESIFDKILNFVTKFIFNLGNKFKVKDNSLLKKELNILADVVSGNITSNTEEVQSSSPVEESKNETLNANIETEKETENDKEEESEDEDELLDVDDIDSFFDESFGVDENGYAIFDSLTSRPDISEDDVEVNSDSLRDMVSLNEVFAGLNHQETLDLRKCLADGTISYACR
ncbi:MAG: hypothetical protein IJG68_01875 [Bacilli bacterium]|nr:hypothetical protein [Bacilli bacterium]